MSVKALVGVARRAIRGEEWGSIEFTSTVDGNSVRVHRALDLVAAAKPDRRQAISSDATVPRKMSGKEIKKLRFIRHGTLTRLVNTRLAGFCGKLAMARWREFVTAHRAAAARAERTGTSTSEAALGDATATDAPMPDSPSARPAGPPAPPASPARSAKKPTSKRGNASPGDGKKRGKK